MTAAMLSDTPHYFASYFLAEVHRTTAPGDPGHYVTLESERGFRVVRLNGDDPPQYLTPSQDSAHTPARRLPV
jgi:hypothetical protein